MAFTPVEATVAANRVRQVLSDVAEGSYRWTDAQLLMWLTDGQRDLCKRRPDAYVDSDGAQPTTLPIPDPGEIPTLVTKLFIHSRFVGALSDYVLGRCFEMDSADTANMDRAAYHTKAYMEALVTL